MVLLAGNFVTKLLDSPAIAGLDFFPPLRYTSIIGLMVAREAAISLKKGQN